MRRPGERIALLIAVAAAGAGCMEAPAPLLVDATEGSGLDFRHVTGGVGHRELPETMGAGVGLLDYDGDGDLDVYLVQSGPLRQPGGRESRAGARNALYRNDGSAHFERVPGAAGAGDPFYGQGCAVGDVEGDGWDDLLALNWGPNRLYANREGRFVDAAGELGHEAGLLARDEWSVSATFFDLEGDGDLDLYVVNYVAAEAAAHVRMGEPQGFHSYPHPDRFQGAPDHLYLNDGAGRLSLADERFGGFSPDGKGLGVVATDVDLDGLSELYVANDSTPNFLFHNRQGRLLEVAARAGVAYSRDGRSEAGMGIDTADVDGDLDLDLFVTNLDQETNTLSLNLTSGPGAPPTFLDGTQQAGLARPSRPVVGFGALFEDFDADGLTDLLVANGHIIDNVREFADSESHAQPNHLFLATAPGRFRLAQEPEIGAALWTPSVTRGSAAGDLDGNGSVDLVLTNNGGGVQLLLGRAPSAPRLRLSLRGPAGNPRGLGASVFLELEDGRRLLRRIESGRSYASASEPAWTAGLPAPAAAAEVLWPGGRRERFELQDSGAAVRLEHGRGTPSSPTHRQR